MIQFPDKCVLKETLTSESQSEAKLKDVCTNLSCWRQLNALIAIQKQTFSHLFWMPVYYGNHPAGQGSFAGYFWDEYVKKKHNL